MIEVVGAWLAMEVNKEKLAGLSLLLTASSKDVVKSVFLEAFLHRNRAIPDITLATVANMLQIEPHDVNRLFSSARVLISAVLQTGVSDAETIASLLPEGFHNNLKQLLSDIIAENMPEWKRQVLIQQVSLPRLESFDWRVDVKISSTSVSRMAVPTCLLEMKVHEDSKSIKSMTAPHTVSVEFSTETLHTMLDGLARIRDQLASVATK